MYLSNRMLYCMQIFHLLPVITMILLRSINVNEESWRMITRIYETIQYSPVQRKYFDVIEVDIRDNVGRKVSFQTGKVVVLLHFHLKKPSYF